MIATAPRTITFPYRPTIRQAIAHRSPAKYKLYGGAMGGAKSAWIVCSVIRGAMKWPGSRWYLCRKEFASFRRTTLLELQKWLPKDIVAQHNKSEMVYTLLGGSQIFYGGLGTKDDIDRVRSMELTGFAVDEAHEIDEDGFFMLGTRLRLKTPGDPKYQGLIASNPEPGWIRGRFVDAQLPKHDFIQALPRDNPHLPPDYEAELRELLVGNEAWIRAYLEGDWDAFAGFNYVLAYADVKAAIDRQVEKPENVTWDCVIGVDVARYGDDETCIIPRVGPEAQRIEIYKKADTMETAGHALMAWREYREKGLEPHINVDVGGVGGGVVDRLREEMRALGIEKQLVHEINFGGSARDKEHYADWASEALAGSLAQRFREGEISIPNDKKLIAQLTARQYGITPKGQIKIESKDVMKKRGLKSPDRADALMLAFAPPAPEVWIV